MHDKDLARAIAARVKNRLAIELDDDAFEALVADILAMLPGGDAALDTTLEARVASAEAKAPTWTHTFTNKADMDGDPSPFTGLRVAVIDKFGMSYAGFDCIVRLDCTIAELVERHARDAKNAPWCTEAALEEMYGAASYDIDLAPGLYIECSLEDDLAPLDQRAPQEEC